MLGKSGTTEPHSQPLKTEKRADPFVILGTLSGARSMWQYLTNELRASASSPTLEVPTTISFVTYHFIHPSTYREEVANLDIRAREMALWLSVLYCSC